jgi:hypothetical protein
MSKRCQLQKEFYKEYGDYKGKGKYNDTYVKWLESKLINLRNQENGMSCDHKEVHLVQHACKCNKCGKVMESQW